MSYVTLRSCPAYHRSSRHVQPVTDRSSPEVHCASVSAGMVGLLSTPAIYLRSSFDTASEVSEASLTSRPICATYVWRHLSPAAS